jgi:hypothetical protein
MVLRRFDGRGMQGQEEQTKTESVKEKEAKGKEEEAFKSGHLCIVFAPTRNPADTSPSLLINTYAASKE